MIAASVAAPTLHSTTRQGRLPTDVAAAPFRPRSRAQDAALRRRALELVDREHILPSFCARVLAQELHVSIRHLYRCFAGTEPVAVVIARRRAQTAMVVLMRTPGLSNAQVASRAGYVDESTMRNHLRRYCGCNPSEARRFARVRLQRTVGPDRSRHSKDPHRVLQGSQ